MDQFEKFAFANMDMLMAGVWLFWLSIVLSDRHADRMNRVGFAATFGVIVLVIVLSLSEPAARVFSHIGSAGLMRLILYVFAIAVLVNAAVQRSRDIGYDRWLALLLLLPMINVPTLFVLLFWGGKPEHQTDRDSAKTPPPSRHGATVRLMPPRN